MITIIGSGLAGYTFAREFRRLDQTTPLRIITRDDGTYYSKPQLSTAFTHNKTAAMLASLSAEKMAKQLNAEIITHTAVLKIDPNNKLIITATKNYSYEKLILAQGAEVVNIPIPGNATDKIVSVNDLMDYDKFRALLSDKKRVAILGAGLVGCEFANDLLNGGHEVNVIALSSTPLNILLPEELGAAVQTAFAAKGIKWHLNCSIISAEKENEELKISLNNGVSITTDILLSAIGLRPVSNLAKDAGITTNKGIIVNKYLATNIADIYALGDCAEVEGHLLFYVAPLVNCARALAHSLATKNQTAVSYPPMPIILKTPICPIVVSPPPQIRGYWEITGDVPHKKALFFDENKNLRGFALTGNCVQEKMELVKQLPIIF